MDETPFDFRERVAALWKCCDDPSLHMVHCMDSYVPDCQWTRKAEKKEILIRIGSDNGIWKYAFADPTEPDKPLTLEQMLANPNLKNVTIETFFVYEIKSEGESWLYEKSTPVDVNMERLMKCVAYLVNDAPLCLNLDNAENLNTREGKCLLKWLSYMKFSRVTFFKYLSVENQFLGNQFSRWKPTHFELFDSGSNRAFFGKHLKNGNMKRFSDRASGALFPVDVMEGIINSFLKNPERYDERYFHILARFDAPSTKALLERKLREGVCEQKIFGGSYFFTVYNSKLQTQQQMIVQIHDKSCYVGTAKARKAVL